MNINNWLRTKAGKVYLRTAKGAWKRFENILRDVLEEKTVRLKKRRFLVGKKLAWGGRHMGKHGDEIWLYVKLSRKEVEQTLIYEIAGIHFEEAELIQDDSDESQFLEAVAQKIWQNKNYRLMIRGLLEGLKLMP